MAFTLNMRASTSRASTSRAASVLLRSRPVIAPHVQRRTNVVVLAQENGVLVKSAGHTATGGEENPGSPEVSAMINSGGRLPGGKKKTAIITGASSGLGLHVSQPHPRCHPDATCTRAGSPPRQLSTVVDTAAATTNPHHHATHPHNNPTPNLAWGVVRGRFINRAMRCQYGHGLSAFSINPNTPPRADRQGACEVRRLERDLRCARQ
jgi:hypothetical protein